MNTAAYLFLKKYAGEHWWNVSRDHIVEMLVKQLVPQKESMRILEVGCGSGRLLTRLGRREQVYGFDRVNNDTDKKINFLIADISDIPFKNETFDLILAIDVIEHIDDDQSIVGLVSNLLKKDGFFVATVPAFMFLWSDLDVLAHHKRRYTKKYLENIITSNNLEIIKMTYMNFFLFFPIAAVRLLQRFIKKMNPSYNSSCLSKPRAMTNQLLKILFGSEIFFLKKFNFPLGSSLLVFSRKISS